MAARLGGHRGPQAAGDSVRGLRIIFLLVAGAEAMAIASSWPGRACTSSRPKLYNEMFTHARHHDGVSGGHDDPFGVLRIIFVPLMIGARDMAFRGSTPSSFWVTAFGGLLIYYSFIGGFGLYGMGAAPDVAGGLTRR